MSEDMVERVGKAIEAAWDSGCGFDDLARAAIEAMRTPTPAMLMAGRKRIAADMLGEHCGPDTEKAYQAMIDAALL